MALCPSEYIYPVLEALIYLESLIFCYNCFTHLEPIFQITVSIHLFHQSKHFRVKTGCSLNWKYNSCKLYSYCLASVLASSLLVMRQSFCFCFLYLLCTYIDCQEAFMHSYQCRNPLLNSLRQCAWPWDRLLALKATCNRSHWAYPKLVTQFKTPTELRLHFQ